MTREFMRHMLLSVAVLYFLFFLPVVQADEPYITTQSPMTLLSANDGEIIQTLDDKGMFDKSKSVADSITVVHLGPNEPPVSRTVAGIAPNSIIGAPYLTMSDDGRLGFVANHGFRIEKQSVGENTDFTNFPAQRQHVLSVIDLASLKVLDQIKVPFLSFMDVRRFGNDQIIVSCGREFRVYTICRNKLAFAFKVKSPIFIVGFDINTKRDRIVALGHRGAFGPAKLRVHVFSVQGQRIEYSNQVHIREELGQIDNPAAPRFSPDGRRVLVLNGGGMSDKGKLDDVLSIDMTMSKPEVTEVVSGVADGLESLAFPPDGKMAVVACLGNLMNWNAAPGYARLAVIDLSRKPMRLLYQTPIEPWPEGMEFTPEGDKLFVGCTFAHHIAVFDVSGFELKRSPYVIQTGHGHASLALGPQFRQ